MLKLIKINMSLKNIGFIKIIKRLLSGLKIQFMLSKKIKCKLYQKESKSITARKIIAKTIADNKIKTLLKLLKKYLNLALENNLITKIRLPSIKTNKPKWLKLPNKHLTSRICSISWLLKKGTVF